MQRRAIVVTTVNAPTPALQELARGAAKHGDDLVVVGDVSSPATFALPGARYFDIDAQSELPFAYVKACPVRHYARKNIGYLVAVAAGAGVIVDTDDDNMPLHQFWAQPVRRPIAALVERPGWLNAYSYFTDLHVWPRGLPLGQVRQAVPPLEGLARWPVDAPIQQALADGDPDVDAVYRLTLPLPIVFRPGPPIALAPMVWCPFNSQNTTWWRDAFALLYLPALCSFRMTDIWRSLVAQRIGWAHGWRVLFNGATVRQDRNEHDLMRDFRDELPGYLHNEAIAALLAEVPIRGGAADLPDQLRGCYEALVRREFLPREELALLDSWLADLTGLFARE